MKTTIKTNELKEKLGLTQHAISNKTQLPVLQHAFLTVKDNKLTLKSTDLEVGIQVNLGVVDSSNGSTTVPARTFYELVSSLPGTELTLEKKGSLLEISGKGFKSNLQTGDPEEYPELFGDKGAILTVLDGELMRDKLASVIFSTSTDSGRASLTGVLMKIGINSMNIVATDGYRLSLDEINLKTDQVESLIVPTRVLREVSAMTGPVEIYLSKNHNQIIFESKEVIVVGRLIDSAFPDYQKIIPEEGSSKIEFDRNSLLAAVKSTSIFAREAANIIKLSLKKDRITVSAKAQSVGDNEFDVDAKLTGEENEIAFNSKYLSEFLNNVKEDKLMFEMSGPLNPGLFRIIGSSSYLHLIMPIRIQG